MEVKVMKTVLERIEECKVVPVVALEKEEDALPLAEALIAGGLPCAEVTFRTAAAETAIRFMKGAYPEMLVGAGTVLTVDQVDQAVAAGAEFIVSPGFDAEIVDHCIANELPVFPGCITPTEIAQAVRRGVDVIKFFPAEQSGGLSTIKALAAAYTNLRFMPTGGIGINNLNHYLAFDKIVACGGSWMVKGDLIRGKDFNRVRELTAEAVAVVKGMERS